MQAAAQRRAEEALRKAEQEQQRKMAEKIEAPVESIQKPIKQIAPPVKVEKVVPPPVTETLKPQETEIPVKVEVVAPDARAPPIRDGPHHRIGNGIRDDADGDRCRCQRAGQTEYLVVIEEGERIKDPVRRGFT